MQEQKEQDIQLKAMIPRLLLWFQENGRELPWRTGRDAYRIWISEIMLQQTRIEAVKPYYARFMKELPDIRSLAEVEEERLLKLWEGLGYYSRARNLKKCAMTVMEQHGGRLPADYEALKKLPGIGPYTAGAIASIAYGIAVPAVDGNVLRVMARALASREDITNASVKKNWEQLLLRHMPPGQPGELNEAIMELGETICIPGGRPLCKDCPLRDLCQGHCLGIEEQLPVKAPKKARRKEQRTILILLYEEEGRCLVGIRKRPNKGLLAGLYELPSLEGHLPPEELQRRLPALGLKAAGAVAVEEARHIFSHVEWDMTGYIIELTSRPETDAFLFVEKDELRDRYALPTAFRAFRRYITEK
ncbi:MAG: A/G-specific adenine glycosylase [Lachnospiraceae bacterium]|nr:A/G-specific adenine glycosylase [Lachnospiraceae bacterium]